MESLFSFGLYVEHISGLHRSCANPNVAFRFLDYPTVVIHSPLSSNSKNTDSIIDDGNSNDDADEKRTYSFHKGKSCLFKNTVDELNNLLREIPLYVMVFDASDQTSQLKGCCSIPLMNLFEQIDNKMKVAGFDSPAAAEEVGVFVVYNLMGLKTGELKLQLKLNFYGTSLLKHKSNRDDVGPFGTYLDLNNNESLSNRVKSEQIVNDVVSREEKLTEHKGVQCNGNTPRVKRHKQKERRKTYNSEQVNEYHNTNIYCPPPLFLNLYMTNVQQNDESDRSDLTDSHELSKLRNKYGSPDSVMSIGEPYKEILQPVENRNSIQIIDSRVKGRGINEEGRLKKEQCNENEDTQHRNLQLLGNLRSDFNLPQNGNDHKGLNNLSKFPFLSALSEEILKLANFVDQNEPIERKPEVLYENETQEQLLKKVIKLSDKDDDDTGKLVKPKSADTHINNHKNVTKNDTRPNQDKRQVKNIQTQKEKLRFKTTRTQKLRHKYNMKQWKPTSRMEKEAETVHQSLEKDDYDNDGKALSGKEAGDLNLDCLETANTKVGDWMSGLQPQEEVQKTDELLKGSTHVIITAKQDKSAQTTPVAVSEGMPVATTGPGFPPEYEEEFVLNRNSSTLKREHRHSSRSGRNESRRSAASRNIESSMYAFDTFSSEDPEDVSKGHKPGSRSSSVLSQTSSISLPLSKDSEKSLRSKASGKSSQSGKSDTRKTSRSLRQDSVKSDDKSQHRHESVRSKSDKSRSAHSSTSHKSRKSSRSHHEVIDKSSRSHHEVIDKSSRSQCEVNSSRSDKQRTHSSEHVVSEKYELSPQHSNLSNKPDETSLKHIDAPEGANESINSSMLSSVKLEKYQADLSSVSLKESSGKNTMDLIDDSRPATQNTMDLIDDSRPATQASVNTLPEDSVFSPRHVSSDSGGSPIKDINVSPGGGILSPLDFIYSPTGSLSPDKMSTVRPNNSAYSPRKSKHTAPSFQLSKRTHGLGKLDERAPSELSGDTTMREIDMFIGDDSQLTSGGSSVVMTTSESVSPVASTNIPRKYKLGVNKFDNRQVETVKEVDVSADEEEGVLPIKKSTHGDIGAPMQSDFSPHQSKQFVQKKTYDNVFRETLPPFSSNNTNESSNDVFL